MILQKVIGSIYSVFIEILLWLFPIAGFVAGGNYLGLLFGNYSSNFDLRYAFLGLIAGFILDVILFGPVIIFFNMRSSLKNIENK